MKSFQWAAILTALLAACCSGDPEQAERDTGGSMATENDLYAMPGLDHGLIQSPVNILSAEATLGRHDISVTPGRLRAASVENAGHTVRLDFDPGSTVTFEGVTYEFKQCHFHTPSEHQIDGITYPMEMHCVNLRPTLEGVDTPPRYLVAAFLFKMGVESGFIGEFLSRIPDSHATADLTEGPQVYIDDLLDELEGDEHYYSYRGSLTTPPFTETVTWLVFKHIFDASREQIQMINRMEGNNARHVQALYGRSVQEN